ncbi:MAG: 50S ribosomal protein L35 [Candidatus Latescibacterota bacterium]|nr:MAG: 50S ribosomal protein L35 [Candidatus Latescibacterota bacterium]RKY74103.1 MAG: 50S ribosomal protein L35 [Candidatus Latescibacterota bacterium]
MPKMKTRKSFAKRFKITATGKVRRYHAYATHLLTGKERKRKRRLRRTALASPVDTKRIRKILGV